MAGGLKSFLGGHWRKLLAGAGGAAALALASGLKLSAHRTDGAGTPPAAAGEQLDLGPYAVTLAQASFSDRLPDGSKAPGGRALWVRARVENLTSGTRTDIGEHIRIGDDRAEPVLPGHEAAFFLMRDRETGTQLHPALPEDMVLAVPAPPHAPAPQVTLFRARWKARDALSGRAGWYDPAPVATLAAPATASVTASVGAAP